MINKGPINKTIVDKAVINQALEIMRREWENVRYSFEMCGDIGDFNPEDFSTSKWLFNQGFEWLVLNAMEMDKKIAQFGYATPEALSVFTVLASRAAERLGFNKELAFGFGIGYSFVRTGLLVHNKLGPMQAIFCKMFFPLGMGFGWNFDSSLVKIKLKTIFEGFRSWQENPQMYVQDFTQLQNIGKTWKEWEEMD